MTPSLPILYEHPEWFKPLFAALERCGPVLLLQLSQQAEEMDRFAAEVING